jgi:hypothetical protein
MQSFVSRHQQQIQATLSDFNRRRFVGSLLKVSYVSGLGAFLGVTGVLFKDFDEYMLGISRRTKQGRPKEMKRISPHRPRRSGGPVCRDARAGAIPVAADGPIVEAGTCEVARLGRID